MKDNKRFTEIVYIITGLIIFGFWSMISESPLNILWKILLMALGSGLIYDIIFKIIYYLTSEIEFIKAFILGRYYLDGYWVGFYKTYDENKKEKYKLFYERIEQQVDTTSVYGVSFFYNEINDSDEGFEEVKGKEVNSKRQRIYLSTQWHSYDVSINEKLDKIIYCMESHRYRFDHISHGIIMCNIHKRDRKNHPCVLIGMNYTSEAGYSGRIDTFQEKLDSRNPTEEELIEACMRVREEKGDLFSRIKVES